MAKDQKPTQDTPGSEKGLGPGDPTSQTPGAGTAAAPSPTAGRQGVTGAGMGTDLLSPPSGAEALKTAGPQDIMPGTAIAPDWNNADALRARLAELEAGGGAAGPTNEDAPRGKHRYRVKGPGGVKFNGVFYRAGQEIDMGAAEAQSIDDHLEYVGPVHRAGSTEAQRRAADKAGEAERRRLARSQREIDQQRQREEEAKRQREERRDRESEDLQRSR